MDFGSMLGAIMMGGPVERLSYTEVNGLDVSTVLTSDAGYETAIIDASGAHPVERYPTKSDAKVGHAKWVKKAKTVKRITVLGYGDLVEDKRLTLVRQ